MRTLKLIFTLSALCCVASAFASTCETAAYNEYSQSLNNCNSIPVERGQRECTQAAENTLAAKLEQCTADVGAACRETAYNNYSNGVNICNNIPVYSQQQPCLTHFSAQLQTDLANCPD